MESLGLLAVAPTPSGCAALEDTVREELTELKATMGEDSLGYEQARLTAHCSCSRTYENIQKESLEGCFPLGKTMTRLVDSTDEPYGYKCFNHSTRGAVFATVLLGLLNHRS